MEFRQIYSGSSGNMYVVTANNKARLLLDPGVTWGKIQKAIDYNLRGIEGILASHAHKDHFIQPKKLLEQSFNIYASKETFEANDLLGHRKCHVIEDCHRFKVGDTFEVFPFSLQHDCDGTMGFIVHDNTWCPGKPVDENLLFVPETYCIKQKFGLAFTIIAIECNYDRNILETRFNTGDINESLAKRLLTSHQEKQVAMDYIAKFCDLSKCAEIHLLHCSKDNLDIKLAKKQFEEKFFIKVITV